jgi:hypothetical protein
MGLSAGSKALGGSRKGVSRGGLNGSLKASQKRQERLRVTLKQTVKVSARMRPATGLDRLNRMLKEATDSTQQSTSASRLSRLQGREVPRRGGL